MAVYIQKGEIHSSLGTLVNDYVQDCIRNKELPQELVELIRHNFLAKYVYFNKQKLTVEIGILETEERRDSYPKMKIYSYPIQNAKEWLTGSYKTGMADLEFYGRLLSRDKKPEDQLVFL